MHSLFWAGRHELPISLGTVRRMDAFQYHSYINVRLTQTQLFTIFPAAVTSVEKGLCLMP